MGIGAANQGNSDFHRKPLKTHCRQGLPGVTFEYMNSFFRLIWVLFVVSMLVWLFKKDATSVLIWGGAIAGLSIVGLIGELLGFGYYETQAALKSERQSKERLGLLPD